MAFEESPASGGIVARLQVTLMSTRFDEKAPNGLGAGDSTGDAILGSDELAQLVDDLERDPRVAKELGDVPRFRQPQMTEKRISSNRLPSAPSPAGAMVPAVVYRDKDDVMTILNLTRLVLLMAIVLMASAAANIFQYYRRPDRIVVNGQTGRVLSINDRNYGKEENVELGPDHLTKEDKLYVTREFTRYLYHVDPASRPRDVEKLLRLMVPDSAVKFSNWLKEQGVLDRQKAESWQTAWTPIDISVDPNDNYTVNVIGRQEINKVISGAAMKESKQLRVTIRLVADPTGRADRNLRSGFLISFIDARELNDVAAPSSSVSDSGAKTVTPLTALQDGQQ